jgi:hypothetical protein
MFRFIFILILFASSLLTNLNAATIAGGEITYKYLGSNSYKVTCKLFRDCRGGSMPDPEIRLTRWDTKSFVKLSFKKVSIREISTVCKSFIDGCDPPDLSITTPEPIFEEHLYTAIMDFDGTESSIKGACLYKISLSSLYRSASIKTGAANTVFFITADLDVCNAKQNSSPTFDFDPVFVTTCNQASYSHYFSAMDDVDKDSLSYHLVELQSSHTTNVKWNTGFSYLNPITPYWPPGYNQANGPRPDVNPPQGTYLEPQTGKFFVTPTDCYEFTQLCVAVREWRKDGSGNFINIGEIRRDVLFISRINLKNNNPSINNAKPQHICEGQKMEFIIQSDDKQYIPPPPAIADPPDTTTLIWKSSIPGASITLLDSTARLKALKVSWTPPKGSSRTAPYYLSLKLVDNACNQKAVVFYKIPVYVYQEPNVHKKLLKLNSNTWLYYAEDDTSFRGVTSKSLQVIDSNGNQSILNHIIKYGNAGNPDTIRIRKSGKFIIRLAATSGCTSYYFDTIQTGNILEVSLGDNLTMPVCLDQYYQIKAEVKNAKGPLKYIWKTSENTFDDTLGEITYQIKKTSKSIYLTVSDSTGDKNTTELKFNYSLNKPKFSLGRDTISCISQTVQLIAKPLNQSNYSVPRQWEWFLDTQQIRFKSNPNYTTLFDTAIIPHAGTVYVQTTDDKGCFFRDTLSYSNFPITQVKLKDNADCQSKQFIDQSELIEFPVQLNDSDKLTWNLVRSVRNRLGKLQTTEDLFQDIDTGIAYNFKLMFDENRFDLRAIPSDSVIYTLMLTDSNHCITMDTGKTVVFQDPVVNLKRPLVNLCAYSQLYLDTLCTLPKIHQYQWFKVNQAGYDSFPSAGLIPNGLLTKDDFKPSGGKYIIMLEAKNDHCRSEYFANINKHRVPKFNVNVSQTKDSVQLNDRSLFSKGRTWSTGNSFFYDSLLHLPFTSLVNNKVSLKIFNEYCNSDTSFTFKQQVYGIDENEHGIKVYPNPAHNELYIQLNNTEEVRLIVYDALGKEVYTSHFTESTHKLQLQTIPPGIYWIRFETKSSVISLRFIRY